MVDAKRPGAGSGRPVERAPRGLRRRWAIWLVAPVVVVVAAVGLLGGPGAPSGPDTAAARPAAARPPAAAPGAAAEPAADPVAPPARALPGEASPAPPPAADEAAEARARRQEVVAALEAWALAWSEQRVDDYLASYGPGFRSTDGRSFEAWAELRRQRIQQPDFIQVMLDRIEVEPAGAERAVATFRQSYVSDGFSDQVEKRIELVRGSDGWHIVAEEAEP